ncbi:MAG: hypothetical protein HY904_15625 [Deltaproteobacteria bacterium]|nr:hypothetical protein [Deltaproteobacteria bacterium]
MNVVNGVLALFLSLWVSVLGNRGQPWGVVAPLQVAGVAVGGSVLLAGTALVVAYGAYATWGQTRAAVDAMAPEVPPPAPPAAAAAAQPAPAAAPAPEAPVTAPPPAETPAEPPPDPGAPPPPAQP